MKTSELQGAALDWALARVEFVGTLPLRIVSGVIYTVEGDNWNPSTDWAIGGPIIEREKIGVSFESVDLWEAWAYDGVTGTGPTPLIAAMRCYVASKLGDTIDIPEELL
jgi:hypothetical protein